MTLYFISGLGADRRIFEKLTVSSEHKIVFLDWIVPLKNEAIQNYALRLSANINTDGPFSIIGLSFGGMIAIEISKILRPQKTILISSISKHEQRPSQLAVFKILPIYKFIPKRFLQTRQAFVFNMMGITNKEEQTLFSNMLVDTDITFFRWAIKSIIYWEQTDTINNLYRIHGSDDLMFPIKYLNPQYIIKNGKHLMIYTHAREVSSILTHILER